MVSFISKFLFTATVTAPTFLSLGLIGVIKDSTNYFQLWDDMLENKIFPTSFEWWGINISFGFMLICLIGIKIFLSMKIQQTQGRKNHSSEILFKFISEQCGANNFIYNPLVNNICRQT